MQGIPRRVVLKVSGEALTGNTSFGIDPEVLNTLAAEVSEILANKVQLGMVVGGGNLFRGEQLSAAGIGRITGDQMGMLATLMNALALRDAFERSGIYTRVMSAIPMSGVVDHYDRRKAIYNLQMGRVVIFASGTGNPLVTTDSAASLRAIEVEADLLLKATNVDGIYSKDPKTHKDAVKYASLTYAEALKHELGVMDLSAFTQCRDHKMRIRVFKISKPGALYRAIMGKDEGTLVE